MRTWTSAVLLLALVACSFGGNVSPLPGAQKASDAAGTATLAVSLVASPGTESLVVVEGSRTVLGTFNTLPASRGCSRSHSKVVCAFSMSVRTGRQTFTFRTYRRKNGSGALLARSRVVKAIRNGSNTIALTLKGVTKSIALGLSNAQPLIGKAAAIDVVVTAFDASGAVIAGKYASTIELSDSDTSGATRLSKTKVPDSSRQIVLAYNGSSALASAVISARAAGVKGARITTATLRPTTLAGQTVSGTSAFSVVSDASGNVAAYIPVSGATSTAAGGVIIVPIATHGVMSQAARAPRALKPADVKLSPAPDECAHDPVHAVLYCMSFNSNVVNVVGYEPSNVLSPLKLEGSTTTDAPLTGVSFSGATCVICGIAYDPNDNAFIIATANGYELWSTAAGAASPIAVLPAPVSENFGYNALTNQIFSPWYASPHAGLDVIDIPSKSRYVLATPSPLPLNEPDAGAVDTHTNIGLAPEENVVNGKYPVVYIDNLNQPPAAYTPGSYTSPVAVATPASTLLFNAILNDGCNMTYAAVDSVEDLGFFGEEFCPNTDYVAVAQLPSSPTGTLQFSNYVAAELPATPKGAFLSPLDPHAILVYNLSGICEDCGVLFNYDKSYVAIVDLNKLIALNPGGGEMDVPATDDLKGIVNYIPTGNSSPPSEFVRKLAQGRRKAHRR